MKRILNGIPIIPRNELNKSMKDLKHLYNRIFAYGTLTHEKETYGDYIVAYIPDKAAKLFPNELFFGLIGQAVITFSSDLPYKMYLYQIQNLIEDDIHYINAIPELKTQEKDIMKID